MAGCVGRRPLGWVEELRPFADSQPLVLLLPAAAAALLLLAAGMLYLRRDIGRGLLPARDSAPPRLSLLGSPEAQALRSERGALAAWLVGVGAFAFLMGVLSGAVTPDVLSENVQRQLDKLGAGSVVTPSGWLGFSFVFFILAVSLFCSMQIATIREEESEQRLETVLGLPVGRRRWLAGRLLLAAGGAAAVALAAGLLAWAGAAAQGADVSLLEMLGAGANTMPPALLFLSLGALAFSLVPRASALVAYGLVGLAFLWELLGALLEVPAWLLALSPFHDVGLVPGEPFEPIAAAVMLAPRCVRHACRTVGVPAARPRRDLGGFGVPLSVVATAYDTHGSRDGRPLRPDVRRPHLENALEDLDVQMRHVGLERKLEIVPEAFRPLDLDRVVERCQLELREVVARDGAGDDDRPGHGRSPPWQRRSRSSQSSSTRRWISSTSPAFSGRSRWANRFWGLSHSSMGTTVSGWYVSR